MAEITNIMLLVLLLWKAVTILATQGYLLTGPKSLLPNSVETFCVSFEGRHSKVNCTLELIARDDVSVYASTNQLIEGIRISRFLMSIFDLNLAFGSKPTNMYSSGISKLLIPIYEPLPHIGTSSEFSYQSGRFQQPLTKHRLNSTWLKIVDPILLFKVAKTYELVALKLVHA